MNSYTCNPVFWKIEVEGFVWGQLELYTEKACLKQQNKTKGSIFFFLAKIDVMFLQSDPGNSYNPYSDAYSKLGRN